MPASPLASPRASVRHLLDAGHLVGAALLFAALVGGGAATTASLVAASVGDSLEGPPVAAPEAGAVRHVAMGSGTVGREH